MLRTISIGTSVLVQGTFVCALPNGLIRVRVGKKFFTGRPVSKAA